MFVPSTYDVTSAFPQHCHRCSLPSCDAKNRCRTILSVYRMWPRPTVVSMSNPGANLWRQPENSDSSSSSGLHRQPRKHVCRYTTGEGGSRNETDKRAPGPERALPRSSVLVQVVCRSAAQSAFCGAKVSLQPSVANGHVQQRPSTSHGGRRASRHSECRLDSGSKFLSTGGATGVGAGRQ